MKELPKGTKVYKCDFCSKVSISKGAMARHEICCRRNPSNHTPCASCEYLEKNVEPDCSEYIYPFGNCVIREKTTTMLCTKKNLKLYHPRIMRFGKERAKLIISHCDMQMPTECGEYEFKSQCLVQLE